MIVVTRLAGKDEKEIVINAEMVEMIEEIPETMITMLSGKKIMTKEKKEEIIKRIVTYKKSIHS